VDRQRVQKARSGTIAERGGVPLITGADLEEGTAAMKRVALCLGLLMVGGCGIQADRPVSNACRDGGNSCAAAQAPAGMRQVLKGHRIVRSRWVEKTNKESGAPDIGMTAKWEPITERR